MSWPVAALVGSTVLGILAVLVVAWPTPDVRDPLVQSTTGRSTTGRSTVGPPGTAVRLMAAVGSGVVVLTACGWLIPAVVVAISIWIAVGLWQHRDRRTGSDAERTDALASWIENLRDVLIAGDQPIGAISATVASAGASIRPAVRRLAASLGRQDAEVACRRFADDIDDPLGDLIAAGLLIAVQRGARTVNVLDALAAQARHQADRRRLVEAERAPVQREVTLLSAIMGALVLGLLVFGRADYLQAYDTAGGQLFLGTVLTLYAILLLRVQRLARYPRPGRFLSSDAVTSPSHERVTS